MFAVKSLAASLAFAAMSLPGAPALAASEPIPHFRSIEMGVDPAGAVDDVRAALTQQLPAGTPVTDARALLRRAGAHCGAEKADGRVRCRYSDIHVMDDIIQDVSWTVDLGTANGTVTTFSVARDAPLD